MYSAAAARQYEAMQKARDRRNRQTFLHNHRSKVLVGRIVDEKSNEELTQEAEWQCIGSLPRGYVSGILGNLTVAKVRRVKVQRFLNQTPEQIAAKYKYPIEQVNLIFRVIEKHEAQEKEKAEAAIRAEAEAKQKEIEELQARVKALEEKPKEVIREVVIREERQLHPAEIEQRRAWREAEEKKFFDDWRASPEYQQEQKWRDHFEAERERRAERNMTARERYENSTLGW